MKQAVLKVLGAAVVLQRDDIDTDAIFPAEFLKTTTRQGLRAHLFADWVAARTPDADFVHAGVPCSVLVVGRNFGCGSSREHAVWALSDYGIRAIVGLSFGDIFRNNCVKNDVVAASVSLPDHTQLCASLCGLTGMATLLALDVKNRSLTLPDGRSMKFELASGHAEQLMSNEDDIARTLRLGDALADYERRIARISPWLGEIG